MPYQMLSPLFLFLTFFNFHTVPVVPTKPVAAVVEHTLSPAESAYAELRTNATEVPSEISFLNAVKGFYELKAKGVVTKDILTIADFSQSSNTKRLWVIDMANFKVLYNTWVAHGRNTGNEFAESFSNAAQSFKSSLGFYATGDVYVGKHGMSLRLNGLEKGLNDNALARAVVMHGADYVSESFIKNNSRLGRSLGCPAIPNELVKPIIGTIKGKSCLYIYHPTLAPKAAPSVS